MYKASNGHDVLPDQLRLEVKFFLSKIKMSGYNPSLILTSGRRRDEQLRERERERTVAHFTNLSGIYIQTSDAHKKS